MVDPDIDPAENDPETLRFKRRIIAAIIIGFLGYAGIKFYQISTAFNVWKGGDFHSIPPNR